MTSYGGQTIWHLMHSQGSLWAANPRYSLIVWPNIPLHWCMRAVFSHCLSIIPIGSVHARIFSKVSSICLRDRFSSSCSLVKKDLFSLTWIHYDACLFRSFPNIFQNPLANKKGITFADSFPEFPSEQTRHYSFGTYLMIFRPTPIMPPKKRLLPL